MANRAALLIRCSKHEAEAIRARAKIERRTISHFTLNIVLRSVEIEEAAEGMWVSNPAFSAQNRTLYKNSERKVGPRTAVLVRCSAEEAGRIRAAARRKNTMISDYVLHCIRRTLIAD